MRPFTRMLPLAVLLLLPAPSLLAQTAVDPSGHWQGTIQSPRMTVGFEVDLAKSAPITKDLEGTWVAPLTFRRAAASEGRR